MAEGMDQSNGHPQFQPENIYSKTLLIPHEDVCSRIVSCPHKKIVRTTVSKNIKAFTLCNIHGRREILRPLVLAKQSSGTHLRHRKTCLVLISGRSSVLCRMSSTTYGVRILLPRPVSYMSVT
ncbi:hypothetical protein CEXT_660021 [Caerostris extrusa]|uniref:Uncharacterized protein n=1 Tax=Caerostris extrusa TaxID=172846 RepID=A0AAV4NBU8_CAEEX|nr:hypothetical protein CEXT_660021 [Caerostris extrusa]